MTGHEEINRNTINEVTNNRIEYLFKEIDLSIETIPKIVDSIQGDHNFM